MARRWTRSRTQRHTRNSEAISGCVESVGDAARLPTHGPLQQYQALLDRSTPQTLYRWTFTWVSSLLFVARIYFVEAYYIVTYALGIYLLSMLDRSAWRTKPAWMLMLLFRRPLPGFPHTEIRSFNRAGSRSTRCRGRRARIASRRVTQSKRKGRGIQAFHQTTA